MPSEWARNGSQNINTRESGEKNDARIYDCIDTRRRRRREGYLPKKKIDKVWHDGKAVENNGATITIKTQ